MWKHYKIPEHGEEAEVWRPCGRFSLHAGDVLLGDSELEREMIREDGFYRVGEFQPVWDGYLRFQLVFARYNALKLEHRLRLPAHKNMPEFDAAQRELGALSLRLLAPNGQDVPTQRLEVADFGQGAGADLEVFISQERVYMSFFPPEVATGHR